MSLKMLTGRKVNDSLGVLFGLTERKPTLEKNETKQNINMTHQEACAGAKHSQVCTTPQDNTSSFQRRTSHRALTNLSRGRVSEEVGGDERTGGEHKAERAFRQASPDSWSFTVFWFHVKEWKRRK